MNKQNIGRQLKAQLAKNPDISEISHWASKCYFDNLPILDLSLTETLQMLFSMDDSPEFELEQAKLYELADNLIREGEYEELGTPIPEIEQLAEDIGKGWLYCPICHEAWENRSTYAMVKCPKCKNKLHNPMYVSKTENSF